MYYVYILECDDGTLYTGIAKNVHARFAEHRQGKGARYTRAHRPKRIIYTERKRTRASALKKEYAIKRLTRKGKEKLIAGTPL